MSSSPPPLTHRYDETLGVGCDLGRQRSFGDAECDLPGGRVELLSRHVEHRLRTSVQQSSKRDGAVQLVDDRRARRTVTADQHRVAAANQGILDSGCG